MKSHSYIRQTRRTVAGFLTLALLALLPASVLHAGSLLFCAPLEIGAAKSLPGGNGAHGTSNDYDRSTLVEDTLALLTPDMPVLVRMETLRRAAIYATRQPGIDKAYASGLLEKLRERAANESDKSRALALFDAGYYTMLISHVRETKLADGYDLLTKAAKLRPDDGEIQLALAIASLYSEGGEKQLANHKQKALAGAKGNPLLAENIKTHLPN